jgi:hypothetical protein
VGRARLPVSRVEPHTNRVVATIVLPPVRGGCWVSGMAADTGALWLSQSGERLLRVDPCSGRVVATLRLVGVGAPVVTAPMRCGWARRRDCFGST